MFRLKLIAQERTHVVSNTSSDMQYEAPPQDLLNVAPLETESLDGMEDLADYYPNF